jgi:hypothetical protein
MGYTVKQRQKSSRDRGLAGDPWSGGRTGKGFAIGRVHKVFHQRGGTLFSLCSFGGFAAASRPGARKILALKVLSAINIV